jgi:hypothetical protein
VTAPGGFSASASGFLTPVLLIIAIGFALLIYVTNIQAAARQDEHSRIEAQIGRMADGIDVQNWLLSLPQDRRPKLLRPFAAQRFVETEAPRSK